MFLFTSTCLFVLTKLDGEHIQQIEDTFTARILSQVTSLWIFEVMGLIKMFANTMMKNKMPTCNQISILLQFAGEILALLCSDDPVQILVILPQW